MATNPYVVPKGVNVSPTVKAQIEKASKQWEQQNSQQPSRQNQTNRDDSQRNALTPVLAPPQNALTQAINQPTSSYTPQPKTSITNPTPSANVNQTMNPITGGIIQNKPSTGGGYVATPITPGTTGSGTGGIIFTTPDEVSNYPKTAPIYQVPGTSPLNIVQGVERGKFASNIPIYNTRSPIISLFTPELSYEQQKQNFLNIKASEENYNKILDFRSNPNKYIYSPGVIGTTTQQGESFTLGKEFFYNSPDFKKDYKTYFSSLPLSTRIGSYAGEIDINTNKFLTTMKYDFVNMPLQVGVRTGTNGKFQDSVQLFKPRGSEKQLLNTPSNPYFYYGELGVVALPLIYFGGKSLASNIKSEGVLSGLGISATETAETFKGFSPIQIENLNAKQISYRFLQEGLESTRFKIKNPLAETRIEGSEFDINMIKGFKEVGNVKQEITIGPGKTLKNNNNFIQPGSPYEVVTEGTFKNPFPLPGEPKAFAIESYQRGQIGAKGISIGGIKDTGAMQTFFDKSFMVLPEDYSLTATIGKSTLVKEFESSAFAPIKSGYEKELKKQLLSNSKTFSTNELYSKENVFGLTGRVGVDTYGNDILMTKSGNIKSFEYIPGRTETTVSQVFTKDIMKTYHGTSTLSKENIFSEGLKPGKFGEVFTTSERSFAEGYGAKGVFGYGKAKPGEGVEVLDIVMPKNIFKDLAIPREGLAGTSKEFAFKSIEPKYIKGSPEFGLGFTKFKTTKITYPEDLKIDANLKDLGFTRVLKGKPRFETTIDFSGTKSGLDYKRILKTESIQTDTSFIMKAGLKDFNKQLSLPNIKFGQGFKSQGFVPMEGLKTTTKSVNRDYFSPVSLPKSSQRFNTGLSIKPSSRYSDLGLVSPVQTSISKVTQIQYTPQITDVNLKIDSRQLQIPDYNFDITPRMGPPIGGFRGFDFGFPGLGFPDLGLGIGGTPRKQKKNKRKKTRIAPSFTASVFNITTGLPKSGKFGISPFTLRGLPKGYKGMDLGI
jgi:hypothetical protein